VNISDYFHWDTAAELISVSGFSIGWYGVFFAAGFYLGFHIMIWVFNREKKSTETLDHLFVYMVLGAVIGARLGHCFFYEPEFYLSNPLKIFKIWEGGLASHGGAFGMLLAMYLYAKNTSGIHFYWLLDRMALPIALGSFFIRIGNFFNSEIIGLPTTIPWAVVFTRVDNLPRHPSQLYEALVYIILFLLLFILYKKYGKQLKNGFMMGLLMLVIFSSRFLLEFVKTPQEAFSPLLDINMGQWLSLPFVIIGLVLMFYTKPSANKK